MKNIALIFLCLLFSCGDNAHFVDDGVASNFLKLKNVNFVALNQAIGLPADMGTCRRNRSSIVLTAVPASSMSPSSATCVCTNGIVNCANAPEGPFVILSPDFSFDGVLTDPDGSSTSASLSLIHI